MTITHKKIRPGDYIYSDNLAGNGQIAADYGVFVDGKLVYQIMQTQRASWSNYATWAAFTPEGRTTTIPHQRTLTAMRERIERHLNG